MKPMPAEMLKLVPVTMKSGHAADDGEGDVEEDEAGVLEVPEHDEQQQEDEQEADRHDFLEPFGGALLVFEVALPNHRIAFFEGDDGVDLLLGFGDGAAHVAAADGEFQGGIPFVIVAED